MSFAQKCCLVWATLGVISIGMDLYNRGQPRRAWADGWLLFAIVTIELAVVLAALKGAFGG